MLEVTVESLGGFLTLPRAAIVLGIQIDALYKRIERHRVPVIRVGHQLFVRVDDLRFIRDAGR